MKYTDIDYFVFTDAARFLAHGQSPYTRDTYRYTPLLAWLLYPTTWNGFWFSFGKALFAFSDVLAGWLIYKILRSSQSMSQERALKFASIWLLNPMVAQISTRGSSEGLLCVNVIALLWAIQSRKIKTAGILLGLGVHLKIYPFIYGASIVWWLDDQRVVSAGKRPQTQSPSLITAATNFLNVARIQFIAYSLITFMILSGAMFLMQVSSLVSPLISNSSNSYGNAFLQHTYLYHVTRIDHRHNFSPYNILLYLNSSPSGTAAFRLESLAFIPQLLFSTVLIPLATAKRDLPSTMLAQTFAFVTFNKVCTSQVSSIVLQTMSAPIDLYQYFLWYIVFLPFYLPESTLLQKPRLGLTVTVLWVIGQVCVDSSTQCWFIVNLDRLFGFSRDTNWNSWVARLLHLGSGCRALDSIS